MRCRSALGSLALFADACGMKALGWRVLALVNPFDSSAPRRLRALPFLALMVPTGLLAQGSAFDELERIRAAYEEAGAFADHGEIVRVTRRAEGAEARESFGFELHQDGAGGFRFLLRPRAGSDQVVWTDGSATASRAFRFDGNLGQYRPVDSAAAELSRLLGEGAQDALIVPALLLGIPQALPEPDGGFLEEGRYEGRAVRILTLSSLGGSLETELTVDAESALLYRVSVELRHPGTGGAPAAGPAAVEIEVRHHPEPGAAPRAANWLDPPAGARQVAEWERPPGGAGLPAGEASSLKGADSVPGAFGETVEVALLTYSVRVLQPDGSPVPGLSPENFRVRLGRKELKVHAVDWVEAGSSPAAELPPEVLAETGITLPPPGQLLVFFVQAGLQGGRMPGHLKQLHHAQRLLDSLGRDDRVAVVSFDSHLKLRLDFSRDPDRVMEVLRQAIRFGQKVDPLPVGRYPSLARDFDFEAAREAASPERALELTANALAPLLGEKDVVFVGWGVGHYADGGVRYGRDYDKALEALQRANATVSVLDISEADYHTLELGLKQVAKDTGGSYERVFRRGWIATDRLARTLEGYYLLTFENPEPGKPVKRSRLTIRLQDARGEVILGQPAR